MMKTAFLHREEFSLLGFNKDRSKFDEKFPNLHTARISLDNPYPTRGNYLSISPKDDKIDDNKVQKKLQGFTCVKESIHGSNERASYNFNGERRRSSSSSIQEEVIEECPS